jgi:diacylglycerol kinase (ATP)
VPVGKGRVMSTATLPSQTAPAAGPESVPAPPGIARTARVAVVAHRKKTLGGGLDELRTRLRGAGVENLLWYEVPKSRKAPKKVRKALKDGAELVFVWGGDGMVQRCADALAGSDATLAILPAGTANLLATNLLIPADLPEAVRIGLSGPRRTIDLGRLNGEHFAVMAGAGFDGELIRDADRNLKDRLGRLAYVWTGLRHVRSETTRMRITVDGTEWFSGEASCVLFGNVGTITGGIPAFDDARPDDAAWRSGWRPPAGCWSGPVRSVGWPWDAPTTRRSSGSPGLGRSTSGSPSRCGTSWTAVPGTG